MSMRGTPLLAASPSRCCCCCTRAPLDVILRGAALLLNWEGSTRASRPKRLSCARNRPARSSASQHNLRGVAHGRREADPHARVQHAALPGGRVGGAKQRERAVAVGPRSRGVIRPPAQPRRARDDQPPQSKWGAVRPRGAKSGCAAAVAHKESKLLQPLATQYSRHASAGCCGRHQASRLVVLHDHTPTRTARRCAPATRTAASAGRHRDCWCRTPARPRRARRWS